MKIASNIIWLAALSLVWLAGAGCAALPRPNTVCGLVLLENGKRSFPTNYQYSAIEKELTFYFSSRGMELTPNLPTAPYMAIIELVTQEGVPDWKGLVVRSIERNAYLVSGEVSYQAPSQQSSPSIQEVEREQKRLLQTAY